MSIGKTFTEEKAEKYLNKSKKRKGKNGRYTKYPPKNPSNTKNSPSNNKSKGLLPISYDSLQLIIGLFIILIGVILVLISSPIFVFLIFIGVLVAGYGSHKPKKKYRQHKTKPKSNYNYLKNRYNHQKHKSKSYYHKSKKNKDGKSWVKGLEGENIVLEQLNILPENYFVFHDVRLPDGYGNIDHIVVGPTGLFVIETKNYKSGQYRINGNQWYYYKNKQYSKIEKDPGKQLITNILHLKSFLENGGISESGIYANGIIALVQNNYSITRQPENYKVFPPSAIPEYILTQRKTDDKKLLAKIALELEPYCTELTYVPKD